jgi:carboxymethylenebutenolidase
VGDRLVAEGFTVLAADVAALGGRAEGLDGVAGQTAELVDVLCAHDAVRGGGVGVVGMAEGGGLALWLATLEADRIRAVVPFYDLPPEGVRPDWSHLQASVEGHFAGLDPIVTDGGVQRWATELSELGKDVRVFTYPDTRSGFFDDRRPDVYDAEAARQAWVRTLEFLRAKLG